MVLLGVLITAISSTIMAETTTVGPSWIAQGPGPIQNAPMVINVFPDNEGVGAIHTVLSVPTNADVLYVGTVNGGIWKTTNATSLSPSWSQLTEKFRSTSIGAMEFDPTDPTYNTIVVGIGRFSSYGGEGGLLNGLLLTTNGGDSFKELSGPLLQGRNFSGVAKRGNVIVAAANTLNGARNGGIYRSVDSGTTWDFVSLTAGLTGPEVMIANVVPGTPVTINSPNHGLRPRPAASEDRLVVARGNSEYVHVAGVDGTTGANGIFRVNVIDADNFTLEGSSDTNAYSGGGTWTKVPGVFDLVGDPQDPELFYVAMEGTGIFRSNDSGATWTNVSAGDPLLNAAITDDCRPPAPPIGCPNNNTEMAISPTTGRLYVAVLRDDQQAYFGFTDDNGGIWTAMDRGNVRGGAVIFSIVADPVDQDIVYVGGKEGDILQRGDASQPTGMGMQWESLT